MEVTNQPYVYTDSDSRIQEILSSAETFEERNDIPSRDRLTFSNGFYVNCTALFIDIRGSSKLTESHTRPVLGKLYRAYLSECVAIMNGNPLCREAFINGDCVSGIFSTTVRQHVDRIFETAGQLSSLIKILNWRLAQKGYATFNCGIGMDYGRALMVKAGYKGSGINDVIWMGDVVNSASNLCHDGNKGERQSLQVSLAIQGSLNTTYQDYLKPVHTPLGFAIEKYEGEIHNIAMEAYIQELIRKKTISEKALWAAIMAPVGPKPPSLLNGLIRPRRL